MGKAFNDANGEATKSGMDYVKLEMGENRVRLVGDILPRYAYWKKMGEATIPVECLSFDRELERFTNIEKDWFKHYFPTKDNGEDMKCSWSYVIQAIDLKDGKLKLFGLKKKLYDQIKDAAVKHLGDPTDPEKGWDVIFEKKKTGSSIFNVEYNLDILSCKNRPLNEEELEVIKDLKPIDEIIPRPTPEEQKAFIEKVWLDNAGNKNEDNADSDAVDAFDDDIPF